MRVVVFFNCFVLSAVCVEPTEQRKEHFNVCQRQQKVMLTETCIRFLSCRVFVNRSLAMEKIKCFGFDMDYTLAGQ